MRNYFFLFVFAMLFSACGVGQKYDEGHPSDKDKEELSSDWDKMQWDKGKWK